MLLAKYVKYKTNLEKILKSLISYCCLRNIRKYPDYIEHIRKYVFAMIWQLGPPTFFVTFTSVEYLWPPLCTALQETRSKYFRKIGKTNFDEILESLIRQHTIICSCYYKHRMPAHKTLILSNNEFLGDIKDYLFITEFQSTWNGHNHGYFWTKNALVIHRQNNSKNSKHSLQNHFTMA